MGTDKGYAMWFYEMMRMCPARLLGETEGLKMEGYGVAVLKSDKLRRTRSQREDARLDVSYLKLHVYV